MLGFDALGSLALGQASTGAGPTNYLRTLTTNVSALARNRKAVSPAAKRANISAAASMLRPVNRIKALSAAISVAAFNVRRVGKPQRANVSAAAFSRPRSITKHPTAFVKVTATSLKAIVRVPFTVHVSAGAALFKNIAKPLRAFVSVFSQMIEFAGNIVSRRVLSDPVDYFMEGLPQYREKHQTFEPGKGAGGEDVKVSAGPRGRIKGPKPSFTTRTDKRGYD